MTQDAVKLRTRDAILLYLYHNQIKHEASYSGVKRATIQKQIAKFNGIQRCLSTISYHLGNLRRNKLITVHEQFGTHQDGTHFNMISHRAFTRKGLKYLKQFIGKIKKWLWKWAFDGVKLPRKDFKPQPSQHYKVTQRPPRRSAANPITLGNALKSTLGALT